jgi:hypothetical protein
MLIELEVLVLIFAVTIVVVLVTASTGRDSYRSSVLPLRAMLFLFSSSLNRAGIRL